MAEAVKTRINRIDSNNRKDFANKLVRILLEGGENYTTKDEISERLNLTSGQISGLIKYMRRCSLDDLERYIKFYPISSKKGYRLPRTSQDFFKCFATLYSWAQSILKTIQPMEQQMLRDGIDIYGMLAEIEAGNQESDNYLEDIQINKDTAWYFE